MIPWKLWASVPTVELWEAVALVLEIEPGSLKHSPTGWMDGGPGRPPGGPFLEPRSFPSQAKCADFDKASSFAERAVNVAGPIYLRTGLAAGMNKRTAQVSLAEVVAFFVSCEWPGISAPLLALVAAAPSTPAENAAAPEVTDSAINAPARARRDLLTPVIEAAQKECADQFDAPAVWTALERMARSGRRPLLGVSDDGIKWQDSNDEPQFLALKNLRERLKRSKKKAL